MKPFRVIGIVLILMLSFSPFGPVSAQSVKGVIPSTQNLTPLETSNSSSTTNAATVVAKVNDEDISVAKLNAASARSLAGITEPKAILRIKNQVLNRLINQILVKQEIVKNQFALTPDYKLQIEDLFEQAMLDMYVAQQVNGIPEPNDQAIYDYIRKNEKVFKNRKTYHYKQFIIESDDVKDLEAIQSLLKSGGTMNELAIWLSKQNLIYYFNNFWRGTEQINPSMLTTLDSLKENGYEVQRISELRLIRVLQHVGSYPDPVDVEEARSAILRGIAQEEKGRITTAVFDSLRNNAKIKIFDSAIDDSSEPDVRESKPYFLTVGILSKIITVWFFALFILVPVCAVVLYHQITPSVRKSRFKTQISKSLSAARPPSWFNPYSMRLLIAILLSTVLLAPSVYFLLSLPVWVTLGLLIKALLVGLFLGFSIVFALYKLKPLHSFWKRKWLPAIVLLTIEAILLILQWRFF